MNENEIFHGHDSAYYMSGELVSALGLLLVNTRGGRFEPGTIEFYVSSVLAFAQEHMTDIDFQHLLTDVEEKISTYREHHDLV